MNIKKNWNIFSIVQPEEETKGSLIAGRLNKIIKNWLRWIQELLLNIN